MTDPSVRKLLFIIKDRKICELVFSACGRSATSLNLVTHHVMQAFPQTQKARVLQQCLVRCVRLEALLNVILEIVISAINFLFC